LQREVIALKLVESARRPLAVVCTTCEIFHGDGRSGIAMKAKLKLISAAVTFTDAAHEIGDLLDCGVEAFF
jgi:hypothetical protein